MSTWTYMPDPISMRYELTQEDYASAAGCLLREASQSNPPTGKAKALIYLGLLIVAAGMFAPVAFTMKAVGIVLGAVVMAAGSYKSFNQMRRRILQPLGIQKLIIADEGLTVQSGFEAKTFAWHEVHRVVQADRHVIVLGAQDVLCVVPKHVFAELPDAYRFQARLESHVLQAIRPQLGGSPFAPALAIIIESPFALGANPTSEPPLQARFEQIRRERLKAETHVKCSTLLLTGCYLIMSLMVTFSHIKNDQPDKNAGLAVPVFLAAAGIAGIFISIGVLRMSSWTRIPLILWSGFSMLFCPVGTILSLIILGRLGSTGSPGLLSAEYAHIVRSTTKVALGYSLIVWGACIAVLLLVASFAGLILVSTVPVHR